MLAAGVDSGGIDTLRVFRLHPGNIINVRVTVERPSVPQELDFDVVSISLENLKHTLTMHIKNTHYLSVW